MALPSWSWLGQLQRRWQTFRSRRRPRPGAAPQGRRPALERLEDRWLLDGATGTVLAAYGQPPLTFEVNQGQTDPSVRFLSRGANYGLFLTPGEAVLALVQPPAGATTPALPTSSPTAPFDPTAPVFTGPGTTNSDPPQPQAAALHLRLVGANPTPTIVGLDPQSGTSNYFTGGAGQWLTNVAQYGRVEYQNVYPGINVYFHGDSQQQLQYDFEVTAGADPGQIQLDFQGATQVQLDAQGNLDLQVGGRTVVEHAPVVYQVVNGVRQAVAGQYVGQGRTQFGFSVGAYDKTQTLTIDPTLSYSTYLGGSGTDFGGAVAVDAAGNAYITGSTVSANFPTGNAFQGTLQGSTDAFVTKLNAAGNAVVYSTYLGGSGNDYGWGIAVDSAGSAYVTGMTTSANFPTRNPIQPNLRGTQDTFVAKLNPAGNGLVYATYLGGSGAEDNWYNYDPVGGTNVNAYSAAITVDKGGNAWVTGVTTSSDFPTTANAFQTAYKGGTAHAFVTRINAAGTALDYSTYLGGTGLDAGRSVAVDAAGAVYVAGWTGSGDFPTTPNAYQRAYRGGADGFVAKIDPTQSGAASLVYSTYLGGSREDEAQAVAVDSSGNAYVTGVTFSTDFPTHGPLQAAWGGGYYDAFVTKINPTGTALVYSTYLGGRAEDGGMGIAVDAAGRATVAGFTSSGNFPTANPFQAGFGGGDVDAFVARLNPTGSALLYSTYLGGGGGDYAEGVALDAAGNAYVVGTTSSTNFPTVSAVQPTNNGGGSDAFVAKVRDPANHAPVLGPVGDQGADKGQPLTLTVAATDPDGPVDVGPATAYAIPAGTTGNQAFGGALGMDFDVIAPITVTQLGVFDDGSDGLAVPLTAYLYDRDHPATPLAKLTFAPGSGAASGTLVGGSRFLPLAAPLSLPAGFRGTIVAEGYGPSERNGNWPGYGALNSGGGNIAFVGGGRWGPAGQFPINVDGGPVNRYAAGTFIFEGTTATTLKYSLDAAPQGATIDPKTGAFSWTPPPTDAVGWWPGQGNANDIAGGNNGTLQGGATFAPGLVGQAFSLNGVNGYVRVNDSSALNLVQHAISVWIQPQAQQGAFYHGIVVKQNSDNTGRNYYLGLKNDGKLHYSIRQAGSYEFLDSVSTVPVGAWTHVAAVFDGSAMRIFINGRLDAVLNTGPIMPETTSQPLTIGWTNENAATFFNGLIDEPMVFGRALSPTEVQAIYNAGGEGNGPLGGYSRAVTVRVTDNGLPTDAAAWYPGDGSTADLAGGNSGTWQGTPAYTTGEVGQAFQFNGSNSVLVNSPFAFNTPGDATLEFWLQFTPTAHQAVFWTRGDGSDTNRFNIYVNADGTFGFDYRDPNGALHPLISGVAIPNSSTSWTHLGIVRTGNTYTLYRNGAPVASATDATPNLPTSGSWQMAGRAGFMFVGNLDEVTTYTRALSAAEVQAIYAAGSAGKKLSATRTFAVNVSPAPPRPPAVAVTEFPVPTAASGLELITAGPDGNVWFTETNAGANKVARVTPAGAVTEFAIPTAASQPNGIVTGPDGNLWFTEFAANKIGRLTPAGAFTEFTLPTANNGPLGITAGADGKLWFTEYGANKIGQITTAGAVTEYAVPTAGASPYTITAGPDGNLWFTEGGGKNVGRITPAGTVTEFAVPTPGATIGIAAGPDGNLWFTERDTNQIGRITTAGVVTEFGVPTANSLPIGIASGPDGNLWFTEFGSGKVGRVSTGGAVTEFTVPTPGSGPGWITAGADGNLWYTEQTANNVGRLNPATILTVTNANDSGRGSLRQALLDANATPGTAGVTINFAIPAADPHVNPATGVATIRPATPLPAITHAGVTLNGPTLAALVGTGGTVGTDNLPLAQVPEPAVQIVGARNLGIGLDVAANNVTIQGLAIYGFGNGIYAGSQNDIHLRPGVTGALIQDNVIGGTAAFTDPGPGARTGGDGIWAEANTAGTVRNNLIGYNAGYAIVTYANGLTITGNELRGNGAEYGWSTAIAFFGGSAATVRGNLITGSQGGGMEVWSPGNLVEDNTITNNGLATYGPTSGVLVGGPGTTIDRNVISGNYGAGVIEAPWAVAETISQNSIFANGTVSAAGHGPSGEIGIDLTASGEDFYHGTLPYVTRNSPPAGRIPGNGAPFAGAGNVLSLNRGAYVVTPSLQPSFTSPTVTIEVWFNANGPGVIVAELGQPYPNTNWHDSQLEIESTGEVRGRVWSLPYVSLGTVAFGTWHHAVLRYNAATQTLDGFLDGNPSAATVTGARSTPGSQYYAVGAGDGTNMGTGASFSGLVDEFRVWNVARTQDQVRSAMGQTLTGTEAGLVVDYRFDESGGPAVVDQAPHHYDGTFTLAAAAGPVNAPYLTGAHVNTTANTLTVTGYAQPGENVELFASDSDPSGFGQGKTYLTTQTVPMAGPFAGSGSALAFNGASDSVQSSATPAMNSLPLTVEAWVNPALRSDGTDFPNNVISDDSPYHYGHGFGVNVWATGSQFKIEYEDGFRAVPGVSFQAGKWYHVAVVYTPGNYKAYVNGQLVDDFSFAQGPLDGVNFIRVGRVNDDTGFGTRRFFAGLIDEVRVWNVARSQADIQAAMSHELTGTETGLAAYYRFDEAGGGTAFDATANHNDAALGGGFLPNQPQWVTTTAAATPVAYYNLPTVGSDAAVPFTFTIPLASLPAGFGAGTVLTATATAFGSTSEFSRNVMVKSGNAAPVITGLSAPATVAENGIVTLTGNYTDADRLDGHKVTVNWGDGTSDTIDQTGATALLSKAYQFAGKPGRLYYVTKTSMSWYDAEAQAQRMGGHLVSVTSRDENTFVSNIVRAEYGYDPLVWLGATDDGEEGVFRWANGDPFTFSSWWYGEPNNYWPLGGENQVESNWGNIGLWNDIPSTIGFDPAVIEVGPQLTFTARHQYKDTAGSPYTVTVTVTDDDTSPASATASQTVTVANVAPVINRPYAVTQTLLEPNPLAPGKVQSVYGNGDSAQFGHAVAVSGNNVVVGAFRGGPAASGTAYVYDGTTGALLHTLTEPVNKFDGFGFSVAASPGSFAVGEPWDSTGGSLAGSVYLFDGNGNLLKNILNPNPTRGDHFGASVAWVGSNLLVGAPDFESLRSPGTVYLFDGNPASATFGQLLKTFTDPRGAAGDQFGWSVVAAGTTVLIGAPFDSGAWNNRFGTYREGAVYLFDGNPASATFGQLTQTLVSPAGQNPNDRFGYAVAALGNNVLVGVPGDTLDGPPWGNQNGRAYLFDGTTGQVIRVFRNPVPSGYDQFGYAVAAVGGNVLVGAPFTKRGAAGAGAAYLFDGGSGALLSTLLSPSGSGADSFGAAVAAFAGKPLVGAPSRAVAGGANGGTAYVFDVTSGLTLTPGATLADSVGDFSLTQGQKNWYYGYYTAPPSSASFTQMVYQDPGQPVWKENPSQPPWTLLWPDGGHPNGPGGGATHWAVRRWVSTYSGTVTITGTLAKINPGGGDGTIGHILVDGREVYVQAVAYNDTAGVHYSVTATVHAGSTVDFAIDGGGNIYYDATEFTGTIMAANTFEGDTVTLTGSFTDPGVSDAQTVTINWGDGKTDTLTYPALPQAATVPLSAPATFQGHTYYALLGGNLTWQQAEAQAQLMGGHLVAVNRYGEAQFVESLVRQAYHADVLTWIGLSGNAYSYGLSWSSGDPVTYTNLAGGGDHYALGPGWWGNGMPWYAYSANTTLPGAVIEIDGKHTFTATHQYFLNPPPNKDGAASYPVSVTVTDKDGGGDASGTRLAVANVAPAVTVSGPTSGTAGAGVSLTSTVTDPGQGPGEGETYAYAWAVTRNGAAFATGTDTIFTFTPDQAGTYQVTLAVTDSHGATTAVAPRTITVTAPSPVVTIGGVPAAGTVNAPVQLTAAVAEPGSATPATYAWAVTGGSYTLPAGMTYGGPTFGFTPTAGGAYTVSLTVTDTALGAGSASTTFFVNAAAPAATITATPAGTVAEGAPVTLTNAVTDPTLAGPFTYAWTVTRGGTTVATSSAQTFAFSPPEEGTYQAGLTVTDKFGKTGTAAPVTITATEASPTVTIAGAPDTPPANTAITLTGSAKDLGSADVYGLTWGVTKDGSAFPLPAGTVTNAASFTFTPTGTGQYVVTLTAADGTGGNGSTSVPLSVKQVSRTVQVAGLPANNSTPEGTALSLTASVTDTVPAGTTFTYAWAVTGPDNKVFATSTTSAIGFTPQAVGQYQVVVTATGSDGSAGSTQVTLTVTNDAPAVTITGAPPGSVPEGAPVSLDSMVSDPGTDLGAPVYAWTVTGPDNFSAKGTNHNLGFTPLESGAYAVVLTVTDANGGQGTATKTIQVSHVPPQPVIVNTAATAPDASQVTFGVSTTDPGNDDLAALTYSWTVTNATAVGPANGPTFTFKPTGPGASVVTVQVADDDGGTGTATTTLAVAAAGTNLTLTSSGTPQVTVLALGNNVIDARGVPSTTTVTIAAVGGNNTLYGGPGVNVLQGDSGLANTLVGGGGATANNLMYAMGTDTLVGGNNGATNLFMIVPGTSESAQAGTAAANTLNFSQSRTGVTVNLNTTGTPQTIAPGAALTLAGQFQSLVGSPGADLLTAANGSSVFGGGGNDTLVASGGSNISLFGGSGDVVLTATNSTNVSLFGGTGNDSLTAVNSANMTLFGGTGNDTLTATASANMTLYGGTGTDSLTAVNSANLSLFGGTGNDSLTAVNSANMTLFGGTGNDTLTASAGSSNMTLYGGTGTDSLTAVNSSNLSLFGGTGNDTLTALNSSNMTLFGGSGNASMTAVNGVGISLYGGTGNDTLTATASANMTLFGGTGNDTLTASASSNMSLYGGTGTDSLTAVNSANMTLYGGSGNDTLTAVNSANLSLYGGSGNDTLTASAGSSNMTLYGGTGTDSLTAVNSANMTLYGGSGNDTLTASASANMTLFGGTGNDTLTAVNSANMSLYGGTGTDSLTAVNSANMTLFGGSGNDTLTASAGSSNMTLYGGTGTDSLTAVNSANLSLYGGTGNDTLTAVNSANMTLYGGTGNDTLTAVNSANMTLFGGTGNDTLTATASANMSLYGGSGNDSLTATSGSANMTLYGGSGNDTLTASASSNMTLFGGTGTDSLTAVNSANMTLYGGTGNDTLTAVNSSNMTLYGGTGNDTLTATASANMTLYGGTGNDSLTATASANMTLFGGTGNDTLTAAASANLTLYGGTGNDTLTAVNSANMTLFGGTGTDSLTAVNSANMTLFGGTGNDTLTASASANMSLYGGSGNASLTAVNSGNMTLYGGTGNDTLTASGSVNMTLYGGAGNDTLTATSSSNMTLYGGTGTDSLTAASSSNMTLYGGTGNDTLTATASANMSLYGGSGNASLTAVNSSNMTLYGGSGNDTLTASVNSANMTLYGGTGTDSLTTVNSANMTLYGGTGNDTLTASGSANMTLYGGTGNDTLTATASANMSLYGGTGNDSLTASASSNMTLYGGTGNDTLTATASSNMSLFGGTGNDSLTAVNSSNMTLYGGSGNDTLTAINSSNVSLFGGSGTASLTASGGTGIVLYGADGDNRYNVSGSPASPTAVTLNNVNTLGRTAALIERTTQGVNTIAFPGVVGITLDLGSTAKQAVSPGVTLTLAGAFQNVVGTPGNDWVRGNAAANVLTAGDGNATLVAGSGDATLKAGRGNDLLVGGTGNTTYLFAGGQLGSDVISQASGSRGDTLDFSQLGGPVTIDLSSTAAQAVSPGVLTLTLGNAAAIANVVGSPYGGKITGNSRDNQFTLGAGNTTLSGGGGNDTYLFAGTRMGSDVITDDPAASTDTLNFLGFGAPVTVDLSKSGPQVVSPGNLTLTLTNPAAVANVVGTRFSDTLIGNGRNGVLIGAGGADSLVAGGANETLQGSITQVVFLDFDSRTRPGDHAYTAAERAAIRQRLHADYADFNFTFTQDAALARQLAAATGGRFVTLFFNKPPAGGESDALDFGNLDPGGTASIDVNQLLGGPNQPAATSANFVAMSATIAAHEMGHLLGLRHADSFGPIGSGIYSGVSPAVYRPAYAGPANATETTRHIMASPDSVGSTLFDAVGNTFFGEREAVKLAFDNTGTVLNEQAAPHQSPATAQALGTLPGLVVPNTLLPGSLHYGQQFAVHAADVVGSITIDPATGKSEDDYYSFAGHAGDLMNLQVMSSALTRNAAPIDTVLRVFDAAGHLLASNDDEFETRDSDIIDFTLPADGTYYVQVDTYTSDVVPDTATGNYELFLYSFASSPATQSVGQGDTLVAGAGTDTLVASSGVDTLASVPATEGAPLRFTARGTDADPADTVTYSLAAVPGSALPYAAGAGINAATGDFSWTPAEEGTYQVRVAVTDGATGAVGYLDVTISVQDSPLTVTAKPVAATEGASYTGVVATFTDADPAGAVGDYTATIAWGDGHTSAGTIGYDSVNKVFTVTGTNTYAEEGGYAVAVTVTDNEGNAALTGRQSVTAVGTAAVADAPLAATPKTVNPTEGAAFTGVVAVFTDADPGATPGDFTAGLTWGDGHTSAGTVGYDAVNKVFTVTGTNTYAEEGSYPVAVTVTDNEGNPALTGRQSVSAASTANVADAPLSVAVNSLNALAGVATGTVRVATFTDADPAGAVGDYTATIAWGDGHTSAGTIGYDSANKVFTVTGADLYANEGAFPVVVTVTDNEGNPALAGRQSVTASGTVTVLDNTGILLLDPTGQGALSAGGNGTIVLTNVGVITVASANAAAVVVSGKGSVTAAEFDVAGGTSAAGNGSLQGTINHAVSASETADPLASLPAPAPAAPGSANYYAAVNYSGSTPLTLQPGTYAGGISVSGTGAVTLAPGIYYLQGGGLTVTGQGNVSGSGVMIYNAPGGGAGGITVSGQGTLTLAPPTAGPYRGVTVFQDRASAVPLTVSGQGDLSLTGTLYAAAAALNLSGNADTGTVAAGGVGAQLIVADLQVVGNANLTLNANAFNRAQVLQPQELAGRPAAGSQAPLLTQEVLGPVVRQAVAEWHAADPDPAAADALGHVDIRIAPLPGGFLALTAPGGVIWINQTAAGYGWFTDPSPAADGAFAAGAVSGAVDLLTVVEHELGHVLGLESADRDGVMAETLAPGVRRHAAAGDLLPPHDQPGTAVVPETGTVARGPVALPVGLAGPAGLTTEEPSEGESQAEAAGAVTGGPGPRGDSPDAVPPPTFNPGVPAAGPVVVAAANDFPAHTAGVTLPAGAGASLPRAVPAWGPARDSSGAGWGTEDTPDETGGAGVTGLDARDAALTFLFTEQAADGWGTDWATLLGDVTGGGYRGDWFPLDGDPAAGAGGLMGLPANATGDQRFFPGADRRAGDTDDDSEARCCGGRAARDAEGGAYAPLGLTSVVWVLSGAVHFRSFTERDPRRSGIALNPGRAPE